MGTIASIATAAGGYFMVERVQQQSDAIRLSIERTESAMRQTQSAFDLSKSLNDLRPKVDVHCVASRQSAVTIKVSCEQKNTGSQSVVVSAPTVELLRYVDGAAVGPQYYKVLLSAGNVIPSGLTGQTDYVLQALGVTAVDWSQLKIVTHGTKTTDAAIINFEKKRVNGQIDDGLLDALASQSYSAGSSIAAEPSNAVADEASGVQDQTNMR